MAFFGSFFKSLITSTIVAALFALIGLSLFVGDFPPSVSQVKSVFHEYKKMIKIKEQILEQNKNLDDDQLVATLQNGRRNQLQKLAEVRNANAAAADQVFEESTNDGPHAQAIVQKPREPAEEVNIPKEWQEQFYRLRAEVFRLNQRVVELERQKSASASHRK